MINKLTIQNFQSHKKTELEFDPGVNVVIGTSDSGKTAIIRALRWLVWNRPGGESFRSTWGGSTDIKLDIENFTISRNKDKDNTYHLGNQLFKAFGTDVPEEVKNALNLNEINLQQQLDSPFLLTSSPGEVAKHFNKIAHLDQIDKGLTNIQREIRELAQKSRYDEDQLFKLKNEITKFEHLGKFEIEVEVLEGQQTNLIKKVNQKRGLEKIVHELRILEREISDASESLKMEAELTLLLELINEKDNKVTDQKNVCVSIHNIKLLQTEIKEYENVLQREPKVLSLLEKYSELETIRTNENNLLDLIDEIQATQRHQESLKIKQSRYQKEFDKAMPEICPLCNQTIKK